MKNSLNLMLLASLIIAQSAYAKCQSDNNLSATKNYCCKPEKEHKPKKSCNDCHVITAKDFRKHGKLNKTVVIDKPGKWCLCESIVFDPSAQNQSAIIIDADNVRLDLCGNTLSQVEGSTVAGVSGVELRQDHQNITVTNGTIELFTGAGIYSLVTGNLLGSTQGTLRDLSFENLNLFDNGGLGNPALGLGRSGGIALVTDYPRANLSNIPNFDAPTMYYDVHISNCAINNNTLKGAFIIQCDNLSVEDTELNGTYVGNVPSVLGSAVTGIALYLVENARIANSTANFTESFATGVNAARVVDGILINTVRNLHIMNSQFNNTSGEGFIISGLLGTDVPGLFIENTQFNNVIGTGNTGNTNGFHISDNNGQLLSSDGLKLVNCQFNNITVPATNTNPAPNAVALLVFTAKDVLIESCQTAQVSNLKPLTGPGQITIAAGMNVSSVPTGPRVIEVGAMRNTLIVNSQVADISGTGLVVGIAQSASNIPLLATGTAPGKLQATLIDNCVVSGITSSSPIFNCVGIAYDNTLNGAFQLGLDTRNHCVRNTRISNVARTVGQLNPAAFTAGIYAEDTFMPNFQGNNISNTVNGIVLKNRATHNVSYAAVAGQVTGTVATLTLLVDATSAGFVVGDPVTIAGFTGADAAHFNVVATPILSVSGNLITYAAPEPAVDYGPVSSLTATATITLLSGPAHGVITENCVDNCTSAGYRDLGTIGTSVNTSSMWTKNQAFNNGSPVSNNYAINWGIVPAPLAVGSISGGYPTAPEADNEWYNLDLSL